MLGGEEASDELVSKIGWGVSIGKGSCFRRFFPESQFFRCPNVVWFSVGEEEFP